jgi:hypothetical protein
MYMYNFYLRPDMLGSLRIYYDRNIKCFLYRSHSASTEVIMHWIIRSEIIIMNCMMTNVTQYMSTFPKQNLNTKSFYIFFLWERNLTIRAIGKIFTYKRKVIWCTNTGLQMKIFFSQNFRKWRSWDGSVNRFACRVYWVAQIDGKALVSIPHHQYYLFQLVAVQPACQPSSSVALTLCLLVLSALSQVH